MRSIRFSSITVLVVALSASGVHAMQGCPAHADGESVVRHVFEAADTNGDGALTSEEYAKAGLAGFGVGFEAGDADSDGRLTASEYMRLYLDHHPAEGGIDI